MKYTVTTIALLITSLVATASVLAAEPTPAGCQPLYNGGTVCQNSNLLHINKKILSPAVSVAPGQSFQDKDFIDNIGPNDRRYTANKPTAFRIYLTNRTRSSLKNILVKDIFPPRYLTFVSGNGKYDNVSRTFTATIDEIKAGETRQITIQVLTARADELPEGNQPLCTINLGIATVNNKTSQDTSQICVSRDATTAAAAQPTQIAQGATPQPTNPPTTKGGLPVVSPVPPKNGQKTPETGPETLALIGLLPTAAAGFYLRRKTQ